MMNMKLLTVVTPPYIYHGCYTWKMFWEEKFTGEVKGHTWCILGTTDRSRVVVSTSPWTSCLSFSV